MRLWRQIRCGLWAVGISSVVLLATMECLYRATFTRLPLMLQADTVPALVSRTAWTGEGAAVPLLRRMLPWTLLRALTAFLRARRGLASRGPELRPPAAWTWMQRPEAQAAQGLRGLSGVAFCWSLSEKLPLPMGGSTSAARC